MLLEVAEVFHVDGQTDMTNLIIAFRNFVKAPYSTTAHKTNRTPLAVAEGKFVTDKFLIRKHHDSKIEKLIILDPTFKIKFVTFPEIVPNINQEVLR
jgi:hypothetical protein